MSLLKADIRSVTLPGLFYFVIDLGGPQCNWRHKCSGLFL